MNENQNKKILTCSDRQVIIFADIMGVAPDYLDNVIASNRDYCLRIIQESLHRGQNASEIITNILTNCVIQDENNKVRKPDKAKTECIRETIPVLSFTDISPIDNDNDDDNKTRPYADSMEEHKPLTQRELCLQAAMNRLSSKR